MFGEMKPLMDAARSMLMESIETQIEDARAEIAVQQRKVKRLQAQMVYLEKVIKELSKPPKPFKPLFTKKQYAAMRKAGKNVPYPVTVSGRAGAM
jgi:peptidoglycan hydrolase CwlO-like protein